MSCPNSIASGQGLRVGLLGMADNSATKVLLQELNNFGYPPDVAFLLQPSFKIQFTRLVRKLKAAGLKATLLRVFYAISSKKIKKNKPVDQSTFLPPELHFVDSVNSEDCRTKIKAAKLDLLLLSVDCLVGCGTFSLPKYGTLNAHPGWIPSYRGLGSTLCMVRDGFLPAISVHIVDEGIDTGPVILRETIKADAATVGGKGELYSLQSQAKMFSKVIDMYETGEVEFIDTFFEPSNMTRGISNRDAVHIRKKNEKKLDRLKPVDHLN